MAAGLGFKDFVTGEVLTAADVDGYLMQGVWVFASAAARDAAVTSPQEGNFAYLKDTNVTTYYTGSAWANLDTTGMTNPMTTTGDTIYSSSGSTPARLGIGSTGQVLTVAGGVPSWATASSGSFAKITSGSFSAVSGVNLDSIFSATYKNYLVLVYNLGSADSPFDQALSLQFRYSGSTETGSNYYGSNWQINNSNTQTSSGFSAAGQATLMKNVGDSGRSFVYSYFTHVGNSSQSAAYFSDYYTGTGQSRGLSSALVAQNRTYDGIRLTCSSNISGNYIVYGLEN